MSPGMKKRATQCVQREYSWPLAALAQSPLAHSYLPRRSIITHGRRTTALLPHHRTPATVTDGLGMTARPVGRCRAETACPTDGALGAVLAESGGGPLMQRGAEKHRGDCFAIFAVIRRASSLVSSLAADRSAWRWR